MKKIFLSLLFIITLSVSIFAAPKSKAKSFVFDFSKDFYPGIGYVCLNGASFKDAYFVKADVVKNEYVFEKVTCYAALVPLYLTLTVTVQKDGSLSYDYSDLYYKENKTKTGMTPLVAVSAITKDFDTLLPKVFGDENLYNEAKAKFFEEPGMLQAMTKGITDIRAAKFAQMVKDAPINMPVSVVEAKLNTNEDYKDFSYYVSAIIFVSPLSSLHFVFYTNDDEKADVASGDKIKITGLIKDFSKIPFAGENLAFTVVDIE